MLLHSSERGGRKSTEGRREEAFQGGARRGKARQIWTLNRKKFSASLQIGCGSARKMISPGRRLAYLTPQCFKVYTSYSTTKNASPIHLAFK
ncbi:hypothetical protein GBA52_009098 [Prunus armeniaca]|nr:hypothetical protein GBA52_009098 [Prunus armeniaca]